MTFVYTFALWLLFPYIFLRLLWRARKQPEYLHHIAERFGLYSIRSSKPVIWLHAVSVGETRAMQSLVTRLHANYPGHQILFTHTTPTGRAASEQLYGSSVLRVYLPYDYPFAVYGFLRHFRPQLGILMETEIWFNLIRACHKTETPLLLLNARMSERSALGYARFASLTRNALAKLSAVAAQTADDAARLTSLGANNVSVMGNLKFDIEPPPAMLDLGRQLRRQFGASRKIFLAASTREGEELMLLDSLRQIHVTDLLLVIVPRHPQRFNEVSNLIASRGLSFQLRSKNAAVGGETKVVLGDSMGEMFAYYAAADIAFIGGSLMPYGGQNLIESCAVGTPVIVGPHMHNFAEATRQAVSAGAAVQVPNTSELTAEVQRLLLDPVLLHGMQLHCSEFVGANRGATEKSLQLVNQLLR
ncbi:MAG: lipid IV(A) 3-deoxy-D-manno-octulosonic acid transferase [Gallionella sp.]